MNGKNDCRGWTKPAGGCFDRVNLKVSSLRDGHECGREENVRSSRSVILVDWQGSWMQLEDCNASSVWKRGAGLYSGRTADAGRSSSLKLEVGAWGM